MILRPIKALKHLMAAAMLLVLALVGVELWLRSTIPGSVPVVTGRAAAAAQILLVPSQSRHHELKSSSKQSVVVNPGAAQSRRVEFRTNELGCRGDEMVLKRPSGSYRILVLGDDSVCGPFIDEQHTVSHRIRQLVERTTQAPVEVINGGVPGYCPLLSWLQFDQSLAVLKPDLVVLHFDMSDVADDLQYRRHLSLAGASVAGSGAAAVCVHPTLAEKPGKRISPVAFENLLQQSAMASWLMKRSKNYVQTARPGAAVIAAVESPYAWISDSPPDLRTQVRHALDPIGLLNESVKRNGGRLLVTTCPVLWQVLSADEAPELSRRSQIAGSTPYTSSLPFDVLTEYCRRAAIPFCDTSAVFRRSDIRSRLFSRTNASLSEYGTALYAREIVAFLTASPPSGWGS